MKFRCFTKDPVVIVQEGNLRLVREGDIIDAATTPRGGFVAVDSTPKPQPVKKAVKQTTKKVIKDADSTEASSIR